MKKRARKLHLGSGTVKLDGWVNIDNQPYENVDEVLDVRLGLPYEDVQFIFAEHFIEHLDYSDALQFLKECRHVLRDDGVLRITTPNLDWVWLSQYHYGDWHDPKEKVRDCFWINKSFRGWGHRFLYNFETLTQTLIEAGFRDVVAASYGVSKHPELASLERHDQYIDLPGASHLIVAEASGRGVERSATLDEPLSDYAAVINLK